MKKAAHVAAFFIGTSFQRKRESIVISASASVHGRERPPWLFSSGSAVRVTSLCFAKEK